MTDPGTIAAAALSAAAMAAAGAAVLPNLASKMLAYKLSTIKEAWAENLSAFTERFPDGMPRALDKLSREDAETAAWARRQVAQVAAGNLFPYQVERLREAGVVGANKDIADLDLTPAADEARYALAPSAAERALTGAAAAAFALAVFLPLTGAGAQLLGMDPSPTALGAAGWRYWAAAACGAAMWLALLAAVRIDLRVRLLPVELCLAIAPLAALTALLAGGLQALAAGAACGALLYMLLAAANMLMSRTGSLAAVGRGDMRLIPLLAVATGPAGTVLGFSAAAVLMAALAIAALARGGNRHSYVPYGPGLALWALTGLYAQLLCALA